MSTASAAISPPTNLPMEWRYDDSTFTLREMVASITFSPPLTRAMLATGARGDAPVPSSGATINPWESRLRTMYGIAHPAAATAYNSESGNERIVSFGDRGCICEILPHSIMAIGTDISERTINETLTKAFSLCTAIAAPQTLTPGESRIVSMVFTVKEATCLKYALTADPLCLDAISERFTIGRPGAYYSKRLTAAAAATSSTSEVFCTARPAAAYVPSPWLSRLLGVGVPVDSNAATLQHPTLPIQLTTPTGSSTSYVKDVALEVDNSILDRNHAAAAASAPLTGGVHQPRHYRPEALKSASEMVVWEPSVLPALLFRVPFHTPGNSSAPTVAATASAAILAWDGTALMTIFGVRSPQQAMEAYLVFSAGLLRRPPADATQSLALRSPAILNALRAVEEAEAIVRQSRAAPTADAAAAGAAGKDNGDFINEPELQLEAAGDEREPSDDDDDAADVADEDEGMLDDDDEEEEEAEENLDKKPRRPRPSDPSAPPKRAYKRRKSTGGAADAAGEGAAASEKKQRVSSSGKGNAAAATAALPTT